MSLTWLDFSHFTTVEPWLRTMVAKYPFDEDYVQILLKSSWHDKYLSSCEMWRTNSSAYHVQIEELLNIEHSSCGVSVFHIIRCQTTHAEWMPNMRQKQDENIMQHEEKVTS